MPWPSCPPTVPYSDCPFPPPGRFGQLPRFPQYYGQFRLLDAPRGSPCGSTAQFPSAAHFFDTCTQRDGKLRRPGALPRRPRSPILGYTEISQVPGQPLYDVPCSPTPAIRAVLAMTAGAVLPSGSTIPSASAISWISGLYHTAHLLAVYASQRRSPGHHARLAPGPLAELWPDGICTRWVVFTIFKSAHRGLLVFVPSFAWRNVDTIVVVWCPQCEVPAPICRARRCARDRE